MRATIEHDGSVTHLDLDVDVPVSLGRSGHGADVDLGEHPAISRRALAICRREGGRLAVHSMQSVGSVQVLDGQRRVVATLRKQETYLCLASGTVEVRVVVGGTVASVSVETRSAAATAPGAPAAGSLTVSPWSVRSIWYPSPEDEWKAVVVLAVLAARAPGAFRQLRALSSTWLGTDMSAGRLTGRLDRALDEFGIEARGDKIPLIAHHAVGTGLLTDQDVVTVSEELERRRLGTPGPRP